ncbi:MAG: hypothetical protein HOI47_05815 [Candidatus Scalindua sp.]|jgi:hypothetical protein|nr:hypothetical protein [Candidatus Scalindua sp.]
MKNGKFEVGDKIRVRAKGNITLNAIKHTDVGLFTEVQTIDDVGNMPLTEHPNHQDIHVAGYPYMLSSLDAKLVSRC